MKKIKSMLLPIYVIFNVLTVLVCSYLVIKKVLNMWRLSKIYIGLLIVNVIILISMFIYKKVKKKKIEFRITDVFLLLMVIFSVISACLAYRRDVAFFGFNGRYEGLYQILYYFSLTILASFVEKKHKKMVVYSILFSGAVEVIYAILQVTQLLPVVTQYNRHKPWATGFITNPNFFGSFMIICLSYSMGLLLDAKEKKNKIIFSLLVVLFMIGVLLSNSLSVLVGLIVVLGFTFIYLFKKKRFKSFLVIFGLLLVGLLLASSNGSTTLIYDINKVKNQTVEMAKGHVEDDYGSNRIYIWKRTLRIVPKNIIHGVGIDNFYYAFRGKPITIDRWFFDKAHNEYLQVLICEGIFALLSYLLFFGIITIRGIKYSFKHSEVYLILPIIGYLVQAFFNISVIEVAPFFYVALGLCINREKEIDNRSKKIGVLGHFGGKKEFLDGQTIKTKEINNYIEMYYNIETDKFDTYYNKRRPFSILGNLISLLKNNDIVIIVIAIRGYKIIVPILLFLNKFYKRRIFDFVVGGSRYKIFKKDSHLTKISQRIETIYVETNGLKKAYNKVGLKNVEVMSNFKNIEKTSIKKEYNKDHIKVCMFSRIIKEKGIDDGIESVIMTNNKLKKDVFELDIYGVINKDYKEEFGNLVNNSPKYITYKGTIPFDDSVKTLENYDLMLFLTYYKNEGFAGTLIDAFNSGLPIIATDWHNNFEILKEGKTGIKVSIKNPKEVSDELIKIYNKIDVLKNMRENVLKEADNYNIDNEMKKFINKI